jgi:DNA-binding NarL/FixJ family response regulator
VPVRLFLVDDHPVVRTGLRALIDTIDDLTVVGEAGDGESAVKEVVVSQPDVVLMDVRLEGMDGVEATRRIRQSVPATAVLMMTMFDDDATVLTAMRAGASGYIVKGASQGEILTAIRAVAEGQAVYGPAVAARLLNHLAGDRPDPAVALPALTDRERDILELLASGLRTSAIAERLFLSPKTVSNHLTSIFAKLDVADRTAAVLRARENGLGRPDLPTA